MKAHELLARDEHGWCRGVYQYTEQGRWRYPMLLAYKKWWTDRCGSERAEAEVIALLKELDI